jgi:hypothetical protein
MPAIISGGTSTADDIRATVSFRVMNRATATPGVEFALIAETGPLEAQALLLVESLRCYGGRHAEGKVTVASPRPARRPSGRTIRALRRLDAEYLPLEIAGACPDYPTSWRVHSLAVLERRPGPAVLVQLDSDAVFLGDVGELCAEAPASARPVDVKGMGSTGPGDDYEPYWVALCELAGVDVDALPFARATVDGARVRATHNGGFVAARRESGLFTLAEELFRRSVEANLRPHGGRGLNVKSGVGDVGRAGSEWWGSAQAVVAVAAAALGFEIGPLGDGVNVPMHSWDPLEPKPMPVVHAHYHWLLSDPVPSPNPMLDGRATFATPEARDWLAARVPLAVNGQRRWWRRG